MEMSETSYILIYFSLCYNDILEFHFCAQYSSLCSLKDGNLKGKWGGGDSKVKCDLDHSKFYSWRTLEFEHLKIVMSEI